MRVAGRIQALCLRVVGRLGSVGGSVPSNGAASVLSRSLALTEALTAVESAQILPCSPDDDGPRTHVRCGALGGFFYSREEAGRRVRRKFPELHDDDVKRVARSLGARVALQARAQIPDLAHVARDRRRRRENWTHGWAADDAPPSTSQRDIDAPGWLGGRW